MTFVVCSFLLFVKESSKSQLMVNGVTGQLRCLLEVCVQIFLEVLRNASQWPDLRDSNNLRPKTPPRLFFLFKFFFSSECAFPASCSLGLSKGFLCFVECPGEKEHCGFSAVPSGSLQRSLQSPVWQACLFLAAACFALWFLSATQPQILSL